MSRPLLSFMQWPQTSLSTREWSLLTSNAFVVTNDVTVDIMAAGSLVSLLLQVALPAQIVSYAVSTEVRYPFACMVAILTLGMIKRRFLRFSRCCARLSLRFARSPSRQSPLNLTITPGPAFAAPSVTARNPLGRLRL